jgi:spermidine synthase
MFTLSFEKVFVCTVPFAKKVFWQFSYRPWEKKKKLKSLERAIERSETGNECRIYSRTWA